MTDCKYLLLDTYRKDGIHSIVVIASDQETFRKKCLWYMLDSFSTYTGSLSAVLLGKDNEMHKLKVDKNGVIEYDDE